MASLFQLFLILLIIYLLRIIFYLLRIILLSLLQTKGFKNFLFKLGISCYPKATDAWGMVCSKGLKFPYSHEAIKKAIKETDIDEEKIILKTLLETGWISPARYAHSCKKWKTM